MHPKLVVIGGERTAPSTAAFRRHGDAGEEAALADLGAVADVCVNGVVGFADLRVTLAALAAGRRLALANKESLIAGGPVVRSVLGRPGAGHRARRLRALCRAPVPRRQRQRGPGPGGPDRADRQRGPSGAGPRRTAGRDDRRRPGPPDLVDGAEDHRGFVDAHEQGLPGDRGPRAIDVDYDAIDVVVHPQSIVHSMVEMTDGSTIAQLSNPDMLRLPIGYALAWPDRIATPFGRVDWSRCDRLDFAAPDRDAFPCLGLAYDQAARAELRRRC